MYVLVTVTKSTAMEGPFGIRYLGQSVLEIRLGLSQIFWDSWSLCTLSQLCDFKFYFWYYLINLDTLGILPVDGELINLTETDELYDCCGYYR